MPIDANCPFTALPVEANVPVTPRGADDADVSNVLVGHMEGLDPAVVEHPTKPVVPATDVTATRANRRTCRRPNWDDGDLFKANMADRFLWNPTNNASVLARREPRYIRSSRYRFGSRKIPA